jgi:hypothetical protein
MRNSILMMFLIFALFSCKRKDSPAPTCAIHEQRSGDTCACDTLSVRWKGKCENIGNSTRNGYAVLRVDHSDCKDWKDSIEIQLDTNKKVEYYGTNSKGLLAAFKFDWFNLADLNSRSTGTIICNYKPGIQYDTLIYWGEILWGGGRFDGTYNWYIALNKKQDTMFAKFCNTLSKPLAGGYYPNLDSCFLTFVRINK